MQKSVQCVAVAAGLRPVETATAEHRRKVLQGNFVKEHDVRMETVGGGAWKGSTGCQ